jgi:hypothetical protein
MKKCSLSTLSLLAIIFAIGSAFTSSKMTALVTTYEIYNIYPDVVSSGCPSFPGPAYHQNLAAIYSNPIGATETIDQWIASNGSFLSLSDFCNTADADQVCLARFEAVDGSLSLCLEYKLGDRIVQ